MTELKLKRVGIGKEGEDDLWRKLQISESYRLSYDDVCLEVRVVCASPSPQTERAELQ